MNLFEAIARFRRDASMALALIRIATDEKHSSLIYANDAGVETNAPHSCGGGGGGSWAAGSDARRRRPPAPRGEAWMAQERRRGDSAHEIADHTAAVGPLGRAVLVGSVCHNEWPR